MPIAVPRTRKQCWSPKTKLFFFKTILGLIQPDLQLMVIVPIVFKAAMQAVPSSREMLV